MTEAPLRIAVIGLGMGRHHVETLAAHPRARVAALCDLRRDLAEPLARQHGVARIVGDWREVVADPAIDAVVVALPVFLHAPVAIAALDAGKHALVEKPMAPTVADAEAMVAAARRRGVVLSVNHNQRFDPASVFLQRRIAEGALGRIHFARCCWSRPYGSLPSPEKNWFNEKAKGGGVLLDLGPHLIDRTLALVGFPEPVAFACSQFTVLGKEQERRTGARFDADDLSVGMVRFADGLTLQVECGFASHIERDTLFVEVYGERGGATTRDGLKLFSAVDGAALVQTPLRGLPAPAVPTPAADFVDAVLDARAPVITAESALLVTRVLDGLRRAAERGWGAPALAAAG